ncbi:MAG: DUF4118 domain-containing protein [Candidatus Margulisbacteria bacterium]|nr:DUF4118 domain-containing protein [Candidatus Margulisiibacteriota bacterium]
MIVVVTSVNFLALPFIGYQAVGYLFLITVLFLSLFISFFHIVMFSILSALIWNFFFIPPFGTFHIARTEDIILNIMYIVTAIITGYLTSKIRRDEKLLAVREARTDTMQRITSIIAGARDRHSGIENVEKEVNLILSGKCKIIIKSDTARFDEVLRQILIGNEKELSVAMWAFEKGEMAGWSTETLSFTRALYVPLRGPSENMGLLSYWPGQGGALSQDDKNLLAATADQLAIYLEKEILRERAMAAHRPPDS